MKIPDARSLSPEAQEALRERVVHAIAAEGLTITEAARVCGVHRCTASGWYNAYLRHGDSALAAKARGRKPAPLLDPPPGGAPARRPYPQDPRPGRLARRPVDPRRRRRLGRT